MVRIRDKKYKKVQDMTEFHKEIWPGKWVQALRGAPKSAEMLHFKGKNSPHPNQMFSNSVTCSMTAGLLSPPNDVTVKFYGLDDSYSWYWYAQAKNQ